MSKPRNRRQPILDQIVIPLKDVPDLLEELPTDEFKKIIMNSLQYGKTLNDDLDADPEYPEDLSRFGKITYTMITRSIQEYAFNKKRYNDSRSKNRNKGDQEQDTDDPDPEPDHEKQHMTTYVDTCGHMTTHDNISALSYPNLSYPVSDPSLSSSSSSSSSSVPPEDQERMTGTDDDDQSDETFIRIRDHAQSKRTPEATLTVEYYKEHLKTYDPDQIIRAIDRAAAQGKKIESWGYIITALKNPETKQKKPLNAQNYNQRNYDAGYYSSIESQAIRDLLNDDV